MQGYKVQLYSRLSKIKGRTFGSSGFSTEGIFISTTVPHCGSHRRLFKSLNLPGWGVGGEEEEAELFISRLKTQGSEEGKCSRLHYALPLACSIQKCLTPGLLYIKNISVISWFCDCVWKRVRLREREKERVFWFLKKSCFVLLHADFRVSWDADPSANIDNAERVNESDED